jgi:shikimate kinase
MPRLIILRGLMGSGKSTMADYLSQILQDSDRLDLDLNADGEVYRLNEVLDRRNVIAEMYEGGSHTSNPEWVTDFKERGYEILSVILDASAETHISRVLHRPKNLNTEHTVREHYKIFHGQLRSIFSEKTGVHEIVVSIEGKSLEEIGREILGYINQE